MDVCVWAMGEGGVGMGVLECLGPWVKGFRVWVCVSIVGHGGERGYGWVSVSGPLGIPSLHPLPPTPQCLFCAF